MNKKQYERVIIALWGIFLCSGFVAMFTNYKTVQALWYALVTT
jgi:hypothetical protein